MQQQMPASTKHSGSRSMALERLRQTASTNVEPSDILTSTTIPLVVLKSSRSLLSSRKHCPMILLYHY